MCSGTYGNPWSSCSPGLSALRLWAPRRRPEVVRSKAPGERVRRHCARMPSCSPLAAFAPPRAASRAPQALAPQGLDRTRGTRSVRCVRCGMRRGGTTGPACSWSTATRCPSARVSGAHGGQGETPRHSRRGDARSRVEEVHVRPTRRSITGCVHPYICGDMRVWIRAIRKCRETQAADVRSHSAAACCNGCAHGDKSWPFGSICGPVARGAAAQSAGLGTTWGCKPARTVVRSTEKFRTPHSRPTVQDRGAHGCGGVSLE